MAINVAQAFVQVVPTTENFLPELKKELGAPLEAEGEKSGGSFMSKFGKAAVAAAGAVGTAIGTAAGFIIKNALGEGMELEQNLGGTEAVFGVFAENIQSKAEDAYKNMGMSASEYMATANKMGALFQGSGFAAVQSLELTQTAMQRAADVASVMGIDTSAAMEAIAGAAKGNFTMMDNLGVAMNATTLEAYAAEKGMRNFTWKTASNLEKTSLAMEMFFDRTQQYEGNFAREAAETLSGSLGAMQSAFKNVLGNLALGQDVAPSLMALSQTVKDFLLNNLIPAIKNITSTLPEILVDFVKEFSPVIVTEGANLIQELIKIIAAVGPNIVEAAFSLVGELASGLVAAVPQLAEAVPHIISGLVDFFLDSLDQIIDVGVELLTALVGALPAIIEGITEALPQIISRLVDFFRDSLDQISGVGVELLTALVGALPAITEGITEALPQIISGLVDFFRDSLDQISGVGVELLTALVGALPAIIEGITEALPQIISGLVDFFRDSLDQIIDVGVELLTALVGALPVIIKGITEALPHIIKSLVSFFIESQAQLIRAGLDLFSALIGALPEIIVNITDAIPSIVVAIVSAVLEGIPQLVLAGLELLGGLFTQLPAVIALAASAVAQIVGEIFFGFQSKWGEMKEAGHNFLLGFADGIGGAIAAVVERAKQAASAVLSSVKNFFGIHSPSRVMNREVGLQIMAGEAQGITDNSGLVTKAIRTASDEAYKTFDTDIAYNAAVNAETMQSGAGGQSATARSIAEMVRAIKDIKIYLDTGELVGGTSAAMDDALGAFGALESRGIA